MTFFYGHVHALTSRAGHCFEGVVGCISFDSLFSSNGWFGNFFDDIETNDLDGSEFSCYSCLPCQPFHSMCFVNIDYRGDDRVATRGSLLWHYSIGSRGSGTQGCLLLDRVGHHVDVDLTL